MQQNYENEIKEEVNTETEEVGNDNLPELTDEDFQIVDEDVDSIEDFEGSDGDTLTPNQMEDESETEEDYDLGKINFNVEEEDDFDDEQENEQNYNSQSTATTTEQQNVKYVPQSKVNEIAAQARKEGRESAMRELLMKYGVGSNDELDDLFGKGQSYIDLDNDFNIQNSYYRDALAENALLKTGISQDRWEDVKLILGGKNLEITPENIEIHLASHPEWKGNNAVERKMLTPEMAQGYADNIGNRMNVVNNDKPTTLKKLGNEASPTQPEMTEEELARKLYGFK